MQPELTSDEPRLFSREQARRWWGRLKDEAAWRSDPPDRRRLRALAGRHAGERCFVVGNGPSLTPQDMEHLAAEVTIASNGIFLMFDHLSFQPTYYVVEDRLVAEDRRDEIAKVVKPTSVFPMDLRSTLRRTSSERTIFTNFQRQYRHQPRFSTRLDQVAYWGGTVTFLALQLAFHLGCTEVALLGVDHSYAVPGGAETVITSEAGDVNHFDPRYFGAGYRWHNPRVDRMEVAYQCAREAFERAGRRVVNATRGGRLEVFQRVDFDKYVGGLS